MNSYLVTQTVAAFGYPKGKRWGPYLEHVDAKQRVETLRAFKGDGVITFGDFGDPCAERRPVAA